LVTQLGATLALLKMFHAFSTANVNYLKINCQFCLVVAITCRHYSPTSRKMQCLSHRSR
jgi:hypothetical protein